MRNQQATARLQTLFAYACACLALLGCTGILSTGDPFGVGDGLAPDAGAPGSLNSGGNANGVGPGSAAGGIGNPGSTGATGTGGAGTGTGSGSGGASSSTPGTGSGGAATTPPVVDGVPCDVSQLLSTRCLVCHGAPPLAGVPMSLVGYANLTAPSKSDPTKSNAAEAAVRMADAARPMPPSGGLSAQELATMQNWVAQGTPRGTCGGTAGPVGTGGMSSSGSAGAGPSTGSGAASTTGSAGTTGGTVTGSGTGIPCGVAQMLNARCVSCHGTTLAGGAPMSLVTYADLTRASLFFAGQTNIQRAAARIVDTARPMPPGGGVTSTEVAAVQSWVAMGAPRLDCATPPGGGTTTGTGGASGSGTGTGTGTTGTAGTTGTGTTTPSSGSNADVPCAVAQLLAGSCLTCHGVTPVAGAPMSLVSYADLTAPSRTNPAISTVRQAVARMGNAGSPMPPGGGATAAQILVLQDWINAGTPRTACTTGGGVVVPPNPFNTPLVCTSRTTWTGGDNGNPLMHPGGACINCHRNNGGGEDSGGDDDDDAPQFVIAGTVYPTAHEPNDCNGGPAGGGTAQVILTGANGQTVTLTTNAAGNFFTTAAVSFPFRAQVVYQGRVRAMSAAQSNGDCNSCHTVNGANGAPGRIMLP